MVGHCQCGRRLEKNQRERCRRCTNALLFTPRPRVLARVTVEGGVPAGREPIIRRVLQGKELPS